MIFVFILFIFFLVLAFFDFSSLRTHFWPFTDVMRKIRREVTRKVVDAAVPAARRQLLQNERQTADHPPSPRLRRAGSGCHRSGAKMPQTEGNNPKPRSLLS